MRASADSLQPSASPGRTTRLGCASTSPPLRLITFYELLSTKEPQTLQRSRALETRFQVSESFSLRCCLFMSNFVIHPKTQTTCFFICSSRPGPENDAEFLHGVLESIARREVSGCLDAFVSLHIDQPDSWYCNSSTERRQVRY